MTLRPALLLTFLAPLAACDGGAPGDAQCAGAKCDSLNESEVATCFVTQSFGELGGVVDHIHQYDETGVNAASLDNAVVRVVETEDGLAIRWGSAEPAAATRTNSFLEDDFLDGLIGPVSDFRAEVPELGGEVVLRVLEDNKVGVADVPGADLHLDCNPANLPHALVAGAPDPTCEGAEFDSAGRCRINGRFARTECCEMDDAMASAPEVEADAGSFRCTVVNYDDSSAFDSAVTSIYVYDFGGELMGEPDQWDVVLEHDPDFSEREDGLSFTFGGHSLDEPGDTFAFTDEEVDGRQRLRYEFTREGNSDPFTVLIFPDSGAGLMINPLDEAPAVQLDCRSSYQPPEQLFL